MAMCVGVIAVVALHVIAISAHTVPTSSMIPTLAVGQGILVDRLDTRSALGDIVLFHPSAGAESQPATCGNPLQGTGRVAACDQPTNDRVRTGFVKRVVGLPGDRLVIQSGRVIRDGVPEDAAYARACSSEMNCDFPAQITVPRNDYYLMGDNRGL